MGLLLSMKVYARHQSIANIRAGLARRSRCERERHDNKRHQPNHSRPTATAPPHGDRQARMWVLAACALEPGPSGPGPVTFLETRACEPGPPGLERVEEGAWSDPPPVGTWGVGVADLDDD